MKVLYRLIWFVLYLQYCKGTDKELQKIKSLKSNLLTKLSTKVQQLHNVDDVNTINKPINSGNVTSSNQVTHRVKRCGDYCPPSEPTVKVQPLKIKKAKLKPVMLKKLKAKPVKVKKLKVVPIEVELAEVKEVPLRPVKLKPVKVKPVTVRKAKVQRLPPKTVYKLKGVKVSKGW